MILVTFALPAEGEPFVRRLHRRVRTGSSLLGELHRQQVGVVYVGLGLKRRDVLERYLERWRPQLVICSGFAGSLRSLVWPGDFVVARNFSTVDPAQPYLDQADAAGDFREVHTVASVAAKAEWASRSSLLAVDMESAGVSRICTEFRVPVLVARMISDGVDQDIPGLLLGRAPQRPRELVDAVWFAGRMLLLRPRLAERLSRLIHEFAATTGATPATPRSRR
ncbi:MAG: hypothetical protein JO069_03765 [Verrucomicrobia bacterium]|nr:hypothetical protein [Verrucomicrobiota bacterium]